jgi:hypothetical protein
MAPKFQVRNKKSKTQKTFLFLSLFHFKGAPSQDPNTYHMSQLAPISRNYLLCPVAFGTKMPWTGAASVLLTVERFQLNLLIWYGLITASLQRWKSKPCKSINELPHNRITGQLAPPTADAFLSCKCIALAPNTPSATHHQHILLPYIATFQ